MSGAAADGFPRWAVASIALLVAVGTLNYLSGFPGGVLVSALGIVVVLAFAFLAG